MTYVIKAPVADLLAASFMLERQKTMYDGKRIRPGDVVYIIASENEGGPGLIARGTVTAAEAVPLRPGVERQTPRVSLRVERTASVVRRLGRAELRPFSTWGDGRPETELNFKLYRQATNKVVRVSDATAAFLEACF